MDTRLRLDAINLAHTLATEWGYGSDILEGVVGLGFYLDMDLLSKTRHQLVCRCVCVRHSQRGNVYLIPPPIPAESNRVPDATWHGANFCPLTVEADETGFPSRSNEYHIPDLSSLFLSSPRYANLNLQESVYDDGRTRELYLSDDHPLRERGDLHVLLLERWIGLLNTEEQVSYGVHPRTLPLTIISLKQATKRLSLGQKDVYAFTTKPGPHCVFTMGVHNRPRPRFATFISGLNVSAQEDTPKTLQERGYHLYVETHFLSVKAAQDALFSLRREAIKLM